MSNLLAAIEVGKLPWMAAVFLLASWKTGVAAVWGLGFTWILARKMRQWYKDDACDAAIGMKDEDAIFANMKSIAKERRPDRIKTVLRHDLFWLPWMAFYSGRKVAKVIFYPLLAYLDKAQTEGLEEGKKGKVLPAPKVRKDGVADPSQVLVEGVNASKCVGCGFLVAYNDPHVCKHTVVIPDQEIPQPVLKETVICDSCGDRVWKEQPHTCEARLPEGMVKCSCGAVYKKEADFDHVCPDEEDEVAAHCKDCGVDYDPTDELHVAKYCKGCTDVHCKRHDCGARV